MQGLRDDEVAAYNVPFPSARYRVAARIFPSFVPTTPNDPVTRGGYKVWQKLVPGAQGQPHATTRDAGHFLQENKGVEVASAIVAFMRSTDQSRVA